MPDDIPPRKPIGDLFTGLVLQYQQRAFLALEPQPGAETLAEGEFVVRYGIRYLGKPHLSIVPELLAVDYGEMFNEEAMWRFILTKSNSYPRADVIGHRNDGTDEMIVLKKLDVDIAPQPLVYQNADATTPFARPVALIAPEIAPIAERILKYVPRYETLTAWENVQHEQ